MSETTAVRERPILFSGAMVRAILDGRKTQTRRVVKPQPTHRLIQGLGGVTIGMNPADDGAVWYDADGIGPGREVRSPYGGVGDRLWVREAWWHFTKSREADRICYAADPGISTLPLFGWTARKRPSIHMPRTASRITLEITGYRAERVQVITEADAEAEGFSGNDLAGTGLGYFDDREAFCATWNKLNGPRGYGWDVNPWVWVLTFRRLPERSA
jgi:hypothetical protein